MKSTPKVIDVLNDALAAEILAIIQYEAHHSWAEEELGLKKLAERFHESSVNEMKHMEKLTERIIFLESVPSLILKGKPQPGGDALAMVQADISLEYDAVQRLNRGIKVCVEEGDNGSRALLEEILEDEEKHADLFETEQKRIKDMGVAYLATLAG